MQIRAVRSENVFGGLLSLLPRVNGSQTAERKGRGRHWTETGRAEKAAPPGQCACPVSSQPFGGRRTFLALGFYKMPESLNRIQLTLEQDEGALPSKIDV